MTANASQSIRRSRSHEPLTVVEGMAQRLDRWHTHICKRIGCTYSGLAIVSLNLTEKVVHASGHAPNDQLTDRRRKRAMAAHPAPEEPGASKPRRGAAVRWSAWFGEKLRTSDSPPMISCHALPRFHIVSAIPMGDHRAGIPAARPVVIPLFMGFLGRRFSIAFTRTSFLSPVGAIRESAHGARVSELMPQYSKFAGDVIIAPNDPKLSHGHWRPSSECNLDSQSS
jgi:hypothetical protein